MRIKQFLIAVCIGLMFAACSSNDDVYQLQDDSVIRFTTSIAPIQTRAKDSGSNLHNTTFNSNELINVYVFKAGTTTLVDGLASNLVYKTSTNGNLSLNSDTEAKYPTSGNVDIYALYPSTFGQSETSFTVLEDQSSEANYLASDLMYATNNNVKKSGNPIPLQFKHALTKISVRLDVASSGLTYNQIENIWVDFVCRKANLSQSNSGITVNSATSTSSGPEVVYLSKNSQYASGNKVSAIVPPQEIGEGYEFINFSVGSLTYTYIPESSITLGPGEEHVFTLTITNDRVAVKSYSIIDWSYNEHTDKEISPFGF